MKQRKLSFALISILALVGLALFFKGFVVAQGVDNGLDRLILQQSDFPEGAELVGRPLADDDFPGPLSVVNFAPQADGFRKGYVAEGEYPCEFRNEAVKELVADGTGAVGVLNLAYEFDSSGQATAQIDQAIRLVTQAARQDDFGQSLGNIEYVELGSLLGDVTQAVGNNTQGRVVQTRWIEGDTAFVSHLFVGAKDRVFVILAVHGFDDPATRRVFEASLLKLLQR